MRAFSSAGTAGPSEKIPDNATDGRSTFIDAMPYWITTLEEHPAHAGSAQPTTACLNMNAQSSQRPETPIHATDLSSPSIKGFLNLIDGGEKI